MKRITVDTNILVRLIVRDDVGQWDIVNRLLETSVMVLSTTAILETEWVLRSRFDVDRSVFCDVFESMMALDHFVFQERDRVADALRAHRNGMGFADALNLTATEDDTTFVTFDKALAKRAKLQFSHLSVALAQ